MACRTPACGFAPPEGAGYVGRHCFQAPFSGKDVTPWPPCVHIFAQSKQHSGGQNYPAVRRCGVVQSRTCLLTLTPNQSIKIGGQLRLGAPVQARVFQVTEISDGMSSGAYIRGTSMEPWLRRVVAFKLERRIPQLHGRPSLLLTDVRLIVKLKKKESIVLRCFFCLRAERCSRQLSGRS